jgi:uncharacterized cupin superfamily protein
MRDLMLLFDPRAVELEPEPINPDWIVRGTPTARSKKLLTSSDWTANVVVWECTPGAFHWRYTRDETIYVLAGEAFISTEADQEHRFAAGDLGFFPNGLVCNWRITQTFRKFVVQKETMLAPLGLSVKVFKKLLRKSGLLGKPHWPPIVDVPIAATKSASEIEPRGKAAAAGAGDSRDSSHRP